MQNQNVIGNLYFYAQIFKIVRVLTCKKQNRYVIINSHTEERKLCLNYLIKQVNEWIIKNLPKK